MANTTETEEVLKALRLLNPAQVHDLGEVDGQKVRLIETHTSSGTTKLESIKEEFDKYRLRPQRREGSAQLDSLDSLVEHANRFKDEHSALFADREEPSLTAVLNYHEKTAAGQPRFGDHRGVYAFPLSKQWQTWTGRDGSVFGMQEFSEFLEENVVDIADPSALDAETRQQLVGKLELSIATPAQVLTAARGLDIRVSQVVKQVHKVASGEVSLTFQETHGAPDGILKVPQAFMLKLPVFELGDFYPLGVRLLYRMKGNAITFSYRLLTPVRLLEHAFGLACKKAQKETGLPLFFGSPE